MTTLAASKRPTVPPGYLVAVKDRPAIEVPGATRYRDSGDGRHVFFTGPDNELVRVITKARITDITPRNP